MRELRISAFLDDETKVSLPKFLSLQEAADLATISPQRLEELVHAEAIPHLRIDGGPPIFYERDLKAFIKAALLRPMSQRGRSSKARERDMTADELRSFEREVADAFEAGRIRAPVHLAGGNEEQLVEIFKEIPRDAWVFSTWRSHLHALLHGVPREKVMAEILAGRSINLHFPEYRFGTSAIVGGILPIACGVAAAGARVWCFVGDMAATLGAFHDAEMYAQGHHLPIEFVVEDNGLSTNTPTHVTWGRYGWGLSKTRRYRYERTYPHVGSGKFVPF